MPKNVHQIKINNSCYCIYFVVVLLINNFIDKTYNNNEIDKQPKFTKQSNLSAITLK